MDMPTFSSPDDLGKLYGSWNALGYMKGQEDQGLADQFRQQQFAGNMQTVAKNQQEYAQREAMNPLELRAKLADIGKTELGNEQAGLDLAFNQANQPHKIANIAKEWAAKLNAQEIQEFSDKVTKMFQSGDPEQIKQATHLQQYIPAIQAEARKNAAAMELEKEKGRLHLQGIDRTNAGAMERLKEEIAAGRFKKANTSILNVWDALRSGKINNEKAAVMMMGYAMQTDDPAERAKYEEHARKFAEEARTLKKNPDGTPNLEELDVPTNKASVPYGGTTVPNAAQQAAQDQELLNKYLNK